MKRASLWYYRFKKRRSFADVAVASAGPHVFTNEQIQEKLAEFGARVLAARRLPDGSLIPPERIFAFDQTPVTCEIVGRTTLRKVGKKQRMKVRTAGREKERWTLTPLLSGCGKWRKVRALATFHGALPPRKGEKGKGGRRKKLGQNTVAHELRNWQSNGYPPGLVYSCNKTAYFKEPEADLMMAALRPLVWRLQLPYFVYFCFFPFRTPVRELGGVAVHAAPPKGVGG